MKRKNYSKHWELLAITITIIVVLVFSINLILSSILSNSINNHLETFNSTSNKEIKVGKITLNIWTGTLTVKDISIVPDSSLFEQLKNGRLKQMSIMEINIPLLRFSKLGLYKIFSEHNLSLNKILLRGVEFISYKNDLNVNVEDDKSKLSLDSIYIEGLESINLNNIDFELFSYTTIDVKTNDTIFSLQGNSFEIDGLALEKTTNSDNYFVLNTEKLALKMQQQRINLSNANYFIALNQLDFYYDTGAINASGFTLKPSVDKYKLGGSYKYTKEVFDVEVKSINVFGYKAAKALKHGVIDIDSVLVDGLKLGIYKDRHLPFNLDNRPLFLQQKLKALKQPLHIKNIRISNSDFDFELRVEESEDLLKVDIENISGNIDFLTSIKDSLQSGKKLAIDIKGILMDASPLHVNIIMPYNSPVDSFYFSGELGSGDFAKFNQALYPATGIKFNGGRLNSLKFYAHANPNAAVGQMTMLYNDLEAEISKKASGERSNFLSFGANTVLRVSNPSKKGKTRTSIAKTDRVAYKGFGNLLWKTVQSGLINSILPMGKSHNEEKNTKESKKRRETKRSKKINNYPY